MAAGIANPFIVMQAIRRHLRRARQAGDESRVVSIGTVLSAT